MVRITASMQNLQADLSVVPMHRCRYFPMFGYMPETAEFRAKWLHPATKVGADATSNNEPYATFCPSFIEGCQFVKAMLLFFESGMH